MAIGTAALAMDRKDGFALPSGRKRVYFDFHCHAGWSFVNNNLEINSERMLATTISEMIEGNMKGGFFSLVADAPLLKAGPKGVIITGKYSEGEGWIEYKRQLNLLKTVCNKVSIPFSTELIDLDSKDKKIACYIAVEGGDFLGGQVKLIEEAYQDGIRSIQLVHYVPNEVGDIQTSENTYNGLSFFGKELVRKMNELGMAIDVAHASYQTTKDVASLTNAPIILSHSVLEMEADRPMSKRAISKDHAKLVAGTGGVIGAWPSGFNKDFGDFVDNIKRLIDTVGVDHVGIGTDMYANFKPVLNNYKQYPQLASALKSKGFSHKEVEKIMGENAKAVLGKIFKRK